jgi:hypothetical protein
MPQYLGNVRYWVNSGKHLLALSFSGFDPIRTLASRSVIRGSKQVQRWAVKPSVE